MLDPFLACVCGSFPAGKVASVFISHSAEFLARGDAGEVGCARCSARHFQRDGERPFEQQCALLEEMQVRSASRYFECNWLHIKEEWVACHKSRHFTLG